MAMNIDQVRRDAAELALLKLVEKFPDSDRDGLKEIADPIAEAAVAAIQHVLTNAKTAIGGESII